MNVGKPRGNLPGSAPVRVLALALLLVAQTPLAPLLLVSAAAIDGGHRIECGIDRGGLHVRLAHPARDRATHFHSPVMSLLAPQRTGSGHHDHEFGFAAASDATADPATAGRGPSPTEAAPFQPALAAAGARRAPGCAPADGDHRATGPPPGLRGLRTVVLRI